MTPLEIQKSEELVYELTSADVMTRRLITASPAMPMSLARDLLHDNRISGLPVVEDGSLVGIVSVQDLIQAMESGQLSAPIGHYMTTPVQTVRAEEGLIRALNTFSSSGVGRLPVLNASDEVVGIITPGDITRGVLAALQRAYEDEEIRRYRASHVFEDIISDETSLLLRYELPVRDFVRAGSASSQLKLALRRLGIEPRILRRVAIVAYEAEMNVVIHSNEGGSLIAEVTADRVVVATTDNGPGIVDLERALEPGYSTAPDWIREMGFGAGMGLANIQACVDVLRLDSLSPMGTRMEAVIYLKPVGGAPGGDTE